MKIKQSQHELTDRLNEQLGFLKSSALLFDEGATAEAVRLAQTVRVLVHDTRNSTSLLELLQKKDVLFFDTAAKELPADQGQTALVATEIGPAECAVVPILDSDLVNTQMVSFDTWWNGVAIVDFKRQVFKRKDIVLNLANDLGGAHINLHLSSRLVDLIRNNSMNGFVQLPGKDVEPYPNPFPATMRQIAHEVLKTFIPGYEPVDASIKKSGPGVRIYSSSVTPEGASPGSRISLPTTYKWVGSDEKGS
ncbi:MAG TPA: hypothetical protein PLL01_17555 [Rhodoferax sp.]|nr:hypothetical protein [Rhodoferax sp.]